VLIEKSIPTYILRGDGTRKGIGKEVYDPTSKWWQEHYAYFLELNRDIQELHRKSNMIYERTTREINYYRGSVLPKMINSIGAEKGVILLDRTLISHIFVLRQLYPGIKIEDSLKVYDSRTKKELTPAIPDVTFYLRAPKPELIRRLNKNQDYPEKGNIRKDSIEKYFSLFEEVIEELRSNPKFDIVTLNAENSPEEIHINILTELKNREII
jgi:thymidylate kinase